MGLVYMRGLCSNPDPGKWSEVNVDLEGGCYLKIRRSVAPLALRSRPHCEFCSTKWIVFNKDDFKLLPHQSSDRFVHRCVISVAGAPCWVTFSCLVNVAAALLLRVFRELGIVVDPKVWSFAKSLIPQLLPSFANPTRLIMPTDQWILSMESRRRKPLEAAAALLLLTGWCFKYSKIKAFLKTENGPAFSKDGNGLLPISWTVPRLIQAPHDVAHVIAGPRIKPCISMLKKDWHWQAPIFYASTKPVYLQKWLDRALAHNSDYTVFWSDFSMYDSSFRSVHWDFVESLYGELRNEPLFRVVLEAWRRPAGTCGDFKYRGGVCNASGRDDTAFANGVLNGFASLLSACAAWFGVSVLSLTRTMVLRFSSLCILAVCGDDMLGFLPPLTLNKRLAFVEALKKNFAAFGFRAKAFASDRAVDAVFLAHRPVRVAGRWSWAKTIGRAVYKLGWQSEIKGDPLAWFTGVCDMHCLCSKHVPILFDICDAFSKARGACKRTPVLIDDNRPWEWMTAGLDLSHYDDDTVFDVCAAYSVAKNPALGCLSPTDTKLLPSDLLDCVSYVRKMCSKGVPCVLDHWVLRHMVWVDEQ
jgi:hypothetical protein